MKIPYFLNIVKEKEVMHMRLNYDVVQDLRNVDLTIWAPTFFAIFIEAFQRSTYLLGHYFIFVSVEM